MHCDSVSKGRGGSPAIIAGFALLVLAAGSAWAVDINGRTDTGYQLDLGDNAVVNRAYNYENIELGIAKGLTLSMYGGLLSAVGDHVNGSDSGSLPETSDNALRVLQDALNGPAGTWISYSLYRAQISYTGELFGLSLGRSAGQGSGLTAYDGLSFWLAPVDWFRFEAFAGFPWQDANVARLSGLADRVQAGEYEVGGTASGSFLEGALSADLGYVMLSQASYATDAIGASTSVVASGLGTASLSWNPTTLFGVGASASFMNMSPLEFSAWAAGAMEGINLAYRLNGVLQPADAAVVVDSFDAFAAVLGASQAFFNASLDLTEDLTTLFPSDGPLKAVQVELGGDYRQSLGTPDSWNPQYLQLSAGPIVAMRSGFSASVSYIYLLDLFSSESLNTLSAELRQKVAALDFRLGTSFDANTFEAEPSVGSILESFDTQTYYIRVKWQASKAFDLSIKGSYSRFLIGTTTSPELSDSSLSPAKTTVTTQLDDQARNVLRLEIRAGLRY